MTIWTYVIPYDLGGAPNFGAPATTLVVCKPQIRKGAAPGDLLLAFNARTVMQRDGARGFPDPNTVRWAGVVSEVMSLASYWNDGRFGDKKPGASPTPDNIYRPLEDGYVQAPNPVHDSRNHATDIGGRNALVFARSWYFGGLGPSLPEGFGLWMGGRAGGGRQGHRRHRDYLSAKRDALLAWLDAQQRAEVAADDALLLARNCTPARRRAASKRARSC